MGFHVLGDHFLPQGNDLGRFSAYTARYRAWPALGAQRVLWVLDVLTLDFPDSVEDSLAKARGRKPKDTWSSQAQSWCLLVPESAWEGP